MQIDKLNKWNKMLSAGKPTGIYKYLLYFSEGLEFFKIKRYKVREEGMKAQRKSDVFQSTKPQCKGQHQHKLFCFRAQEYTYCTAAAAAAAASLQSCLTLCDPMDGSPPGSPIPGILQAKTLSSLNTHILQFFYPPPCILHCEFLITNWQNQVKWQICELNVSSVSAETRL